MPETTRRNERDGDEDEEEEEERGGRGRGARRDRIRTVRCGARAGTDGGRCAGVGPAQTDPPPPPNFPAPDNLPPVSTRGWTRTDTDRWGHSCSLRVSLSFFFPLLFSCEAASVFPASHYETSVIFSTWFDCCSIKYLPK
uniref:Uncharacterized protein n=1 Tax=Oryza brachyantha TaxID=4533 RepID=J3M144_ORYBR